MERTWLFVILAEKSALFIQEKTQFCYNRSF